MYAVKEIIPISCACDFVCAAYDKCYTCDFGYTWYRSITQVSHRSVLGLIIWISGVNWCHNFLKASYFKDFNLLSSSRPARKSLYTDL